MDLLTVSKKLKQNTGFLDVVDGGSQWCQQSTFAVLCQSKEGGRFQDCLVLQHICGIEFYVHKSSMDGYNHRMTRVTNLEDKVKHLGLDLERPYELRIVLTLDPQQ